MKTKDELLKAYDDAFGKMSPPALSEAISHNYDDLFDGFLDVCKVSYELCPSGYDRLKGVAAFLVKSAVDQPIEFIDIVLSAFWERMDIVYEASLQDIIALPFGVFVSDVAIHDCK